MMTGAEKIEAAARVYAEQRVRWRHQGRSTVHGLDCFGLLWRVAADCGAPVADETGYARVPNGFSFVEGMRARFDEIPLSSVHRGDIMVFTELRYPCHAGIVVMGPDGAPTHLVHAHARRRRVVVEPLAQEWRAKRCMAFAFRGVV